MGIAYERLQLGWTAGIPNVLTYVEADVRISNSEHRTICASLKIALLIEHAIVRKKVLSIGVNKFAAGDYRRCMLDIRAVGIYEPDHHHQISGGGYDFTERGKIFTNEVRLE